MYYLYSKKICVLRSRYRTDRVTFYMDDCPTPFPEMGYKASADVEVRAGYAEEWLRLMFGADVTFTLIDID